MNFSMLRTVAGAAVAVGLTVAGLTTVAVPATAVTGDVPYDCTSTSTGPFDATAVIDTDAPLQLGTGLTVPIKLSTSVVVPADEVTELRTAGIATVVGSVTANFIVNGVPRQATLTIPSTAVPASGTMTLVGTGAAGTITAGAVGTSIVIGAGDFSVSFAAYNSTGGQVIADTVTCLQEGSQLVVIDSVAVVKAPTAVAVTVQDTPVEYGDTPDVIATVTVPGSNAKPAGTVAFTFEGKTVTADVKGGKSRPTSLAQALHKGANSVTAVFTPTDPNLAVSQTAQAFTVVKASTTTTVSAVYRPLKDKIVARGKVVSAFGTEVAGQVKYVLKRNGVRIRTKTVDLNKFDVAKARFGSIVKKGSYVVIARYLGSTTLKRSSDRYGLQI